MPARDWDAESYDRISTPQQQWGADVLARMPLKGDELVLDAGCGTGRVTEMPAELEEEFLDQVHERLGDPLVVDYVRLNIDATA